MQGAGGRAALAFSRADPISTLHSFSQKGSSAVAGQLNLFAAASTAPDGLRYREEFITAADEAELIRRLGELPLQPFQFGAFEGKRRVASFGFRYDYTERRLQEADPVPPWLADTVWHVSRHSAAQRPGSARCSAPNTQWASVLAGTGTSRILEPCSGARWAPPVPSVFDGLPARNGNASRAKPRRARSTSWRASPAINGSTASHRSQRPAIPSLFGPWPDAWPAKLGDNSFSWGLHDTTNRQRRSSAPWRSRPTVARIAHGSARRGHHASHRASLWP